MSLQHAAKHLSAHGRGPDTTLVHMSEGEVKSLNDLAMAAGGHLTINPHTGLPEAGFLSSMLPMIAGAALTAAGVPPPMAAMMVGGFQTARTGSLKQGLMAGIGAYGGAGIGSALASSGTAAAASTAAPSVSLAEVAATTPTAPVVANPMGGIGYTPPPPVVAPPAIAPSVSPMPGVNTSVTPVNAPLPPAQQVIPPNSMASNFRNNSNAMFEGVKSLGSEPGRTAFMTNLEAVPGTYGAKTTLAAAAAPTLAEAMKSKEPPPETPVDSDPGQQFNYEANATNPTPTPDLYGREQKYFNQRYVKRAAGGGISDAQYNLGGYSDGGRLLRGPGDGVSDSIPAVIGKKQPARLADGEFVVPARIVSELGNGSTEAGARKLYAMMDRIQKARRKTVGKGKVAKNSRADKYLPA